MADQIFTSMGDFLAAMPKPSVLGDELFKEKIVDLETWLYDPAYMGLGNIKLFPLQLEALQAMDDIDPDQNRYTEFCLEWGKGSHPANSVIKDLKSGESKTYEQWEKDGRSLLLKTWNGSEIETRQSGPVTRLGLKTFCRVRLSDGAQTVVSTTHRFLTPNGWKRLDELHSGDSIMSAILEHDSFSNARRESKYVRHCSRKAANSRSRYHSACRSYDERPLRVKDIVQDDAPLQAGVPASYYGDSYKGVHPGKQQTHIPSRSLLRPRQTSRLSKYRACAPQHQPCAATAVSSPLEFQAPQTNLQSLRPIDTGLLFLECGGLVALGREHDSHQNDFRDKLPSFLNDKQWSFSESGVLLKSSEHLIPQCEDSQSLAISNCPYTHFTNIDSIVEVGELEAFDLVMPITHCYFGDNGLLHHNSGKDFIAALAGIRKVYQLLCMRNPYTYYGMANGTGIQIVNVAYTKDQAKNVFLKQVRGLLNGSRWFAKRGFRLTRERIQFEHDIEFVSTSADGDGAEGQNIFFAVMDEASAFKTAGNIKAMNKAEGQKADNDAEGIYKVLRSSSNSRFPGVGKVVMISYPRYRGDFIQQMMEKNKDSDRGWTSGPYATWEVNHRVTREDFAEDYKTNPEMAAAAYECKPPFSVDGFIKHPERFINSVAQGMAIGLKDPIDASGAYENDFHGMPGRYYAIHVDLALNKDKCALALARQGEPVTRLKCPCNAFNLHDVEACTHCGRPVSQWIKNELPTMVVELLKYFNPGPGKDVNFGEVRDEILWIRERGHKIWALSYDGWQSVDSRQIMSDILGTKGVYDRWGKEIGQQSIVSLLSVDRNTEAHDTLKEFIYDGRFFIYGPAGIKKLDDLTDEKNEHPIALAYREWRGLKVINGKKIDHAAGACFVGDTRIPLLDGTLPMISELAGKKDIWVYSATPDGSIVPGKAKGRLTKHVTSLVDVVLDSGAVARCTPDHRFMLRDGSYKEAQHLVPDEDRLMPITRQWPRNGGYEQVSDRNGFRIETHRMVVDALDGIKDGQIVHHLDECKINNHPENLRAEYRTDHSRHHTVERHKDDFVYTSKVADGLQKWNLSDAGRRAHSAALKRTMAAMTKEEKLRRGAKGYKFRSDVDASALEAVKDSSKNPYDAGKKLGCTRNVVVRIYRNLGYSSWSDYASAQTGANHKVRYVIPVELAEPVPVYDLEVEQWHNFALSCGVFVHNSKDLVDSLAGCAMHISRMPIIRQRTPRIMGFSERGR